MRKDKKMEPDNNKKSFPGVLLLFIIGLVMILVFQNVSENKMANISFSYQLEALVNLDLLDPMDSKKSASSGTNLVSFSGRLRDAYSETGKDRFRFISYLDRQHKLSADKNLLSQELDRLQKKVNEAGIYYLQITGRTLSPQGFTMVSHGYDFAERMNAVIIKSLPQNSDLITLPQALEQYESIQNGVNGGLNPQQYSELETLLYGLVQEFRSPILGVGTESMKRILKDAEASLLLAQEGNTLEERYKAAGESLASLQKLDEAIFASHEKGMVELRSSMTYAEELESYEKIVTNYQKNGAQLEKAYIKVAGVTWFVNGKQISTKLLMQLPSDEYQAWFMQESTIWESFPHEKGMYFKAVAQPSTLLLETTFKSEEPNPNYVGYLSTFLPIMLVALLLYFVFSRQMKGVGSGAMTFGKSPAKQISKASQKVTFDDVAGIDEAKEELEEIADCLRDPQKYTRLGGRIPKGVLLVGAPGTGKTLLAKAIAGEAGVPFFSISGSDFVEMFVGVGASRVRDLFAEARKNSPCIIFIDEIDAVGRHRGAGLGGGHDEREQTLNQLLVELDGIDGAKDETKDGNKATIIVIAATNRADVLDKALLRPGRFDRRVYINLPDYLARLQILKVHAKAVPLGDDVDLKDIATLCPGAAGADLANIINEAALCAARKFKKMINKDDMIYALDKCLMGKERRSLVITVEDRLTTAYHEAGHTLIALHYKTSDKVGKVTILPRGQALGLTHFEEKQNRVSRSLKELRDQLAVLMGGRVAEEMLLGEGDFTSGAMGDIKMATSLARAMVCEWGMSAKVGMINFEESQEKSIMAGFREKGYSEETASLIDHEIKALLDEAYQRAKETLLLLKDKLKYIADMLVEFETLDKEDLRLIMEGIFDPEEKRRLMHLNEEANSKSPPPIPADLLKKQGKKPTILPDPI